MPARCRIPDLSIAGLPATLPLIMPPLPLRPVVGSTRRLYFPSLDGARGLAILLVLLDHFSSAKLIPYPVLRGAGHVGVYLFFSLSAFLLTEPFCFKSPASLLQWQTWSVYLWRRFLRIYPLYAIVLITGHLAGIGFSWADIANHLLLRKGESIFWSMEIETKYYFVLPLVLLTFLVAWRRSTLLGTFCTAGLAGVLLTLFHADGSWWSLDGHVLRSYLPVFLLGSGAGALSAFLALHPARSHFVPWAWEAAAIASLAGSLLLLPGIARMLPKALAPGWHSGIALCALYWALFLPAHLHGVGGVKRLFEWRPLRYLGLISYSLYLWHEVVIHCVWLFKQSNRSVTGEHWQLYAVATLAISILAASLSFFLIERPCSRFKARFTRSL